VVSKKAAEPKAAATAAERMMRGIGRPPLRRNGPRSRFAAGPYTPPGLGPSCPAECDGRTHFAIRTPCPACPRSDCKLSDSWAV